MNLVPLFLKNKFGIAAAVISFLSAFLAFLYLFIQDYRITQNLEDTPESIVKRMTLEEKVGQLIHVGINGKDPDSFAVRDIQKFKAGGVILFAANLGDSESIRKLNENLQSLALESTGIPLFISIDQEGGRVARIPDDSSPGAMAIGQTANPDYAEDVGFVTAYHLRKLGFNLLLAPVLDINNNPDNPVINTRSFGSRPDLVASMGISHARGIRKSKVVPVIKHFPGHGDTDTDSHLDLPRISKNYEELEKMELIPFKKSIEEGAEALMSAHILFPALDPEAPATLSPRILKGILREKLKYDGLIMTDAMEMHAISKRYTSEESAKKAFLAGADIILLTSTGDLPEKIFNALVAAFQNGELDIKDLDKSVLRQISVKYKNGYFHTLKSKYAGEQLENYFVSESEDVERHFSEIAEKYKNGTLYSIVADDSIRSLEKDYTIPSHSKENLKLIYITQDMKNHAASLGIQEENVLSLNTASALKLFNENKPELSILMEVSDGNLNLWNSAVASREKLTEEQKAGLPQIIALYSGNPFKKIEVPDRGAVFLSFSPTEESRRALFNVYLKKDVVKKADLVFHKKR